ncbi:nuclear transport factor 2 family protein [Parvularcula marina]|uniref:YybH family protein n=1 Tax=Parvularcula marina TaxID=2292771 RepID=UPI0035151C2E
MTLANIILCGLLAVTSVQAAEEPRWTPEQQEIIDVASRGPFALNDDFDAWAEGYHPDWSYWRLGAETIRPRDEHMQAVADYMATGVRIVGFEFTPIDVVVRGDTALLRYNAIESIENPDGTRRDVHFSAAGFYAREEGEWKVLASNLYYVPDGEAE